MPYDSLIARPTTSALIPEDVARDIIESVPEQSMVLRLARRLRNMPRAQVRMPVLSALPTAYFVDGDTGLKQTSEVEWDNVYLNAEEIAVIVPIPQAVLDDADYDIWSEVRPLISQAIGQVIDAAILIGTNAPVSWPDDLLTAATSAGNTVSATLGDDIFDAIMGVGGVISLVEQDGFMVNGHIAHITIAAILRGLRDNNLQPIFQTTMQDRTRYALDGQPLLFNMNNSFAASDALMFSGDWNQLVYSMRQDLTYKILTEAAIFDNNGVLIYNLPQQDMVALRAVMRMGWALPNPLTLMNDDPSSRYPFAVLTQ
jgi:HK97 family phage major capsid protein